MDKCSKRKKPYIDISKVVDDLPGMIYRCKNNKNWTMEYLSEGCVRLTDYSPSELLHDDKRSWRDMIKPEDKKKVFDKVQEAVERDESFRVSYRILTKNGEERWVREVGRACRDSQGNVESLEGFITDVTEYLDAKKRVEKRKEKLKELYEASTQLHICKTKQETYDLTLRSAKEILGFFSAAIFIEEDDELVVKASTESKNDIGIRYPKDQGIRGMTYVNKESYHIDDLSEWIDSKSVSHEYRSAVSVPIGDRGVFQAVSNELGFYSDFDLEMAKVLASHIYETMQRIGSQKEMSLVLNTVQEHIIYLDKDMDIRWENKAIVENGDMKKEGIKGKKCYERIYERDEPCEDCPALEALETGKTREKIKGAKGKHWLVRATPDIDEEGKVKGVVNVVLDITEKMDLHEELKRSEKKYRTIFENTGTAMVMIEEDSTISLVNEEFEKLSGYSKEELQGKRWTRFIFEEDLKKMKKYHHERRKAGEEVPSRYTFKAPTRFGDVRDLLVAVSVIPGNKKTVASITDITDHRKTFGALRESQEAFRILFENSTEPVILINKDKKINEFNDKFVELFEIEKSKDIYLDDILHPENPDDMKEIEQLLSGKKNSLKLDMSCRSDHEDIPVEAKIDLIRDNTDDPLYAIGILSKKSS